MVSLLGEGCNLADIKQADAQMARHGREKSIGTVLEINEGGWGGYFNSEKGSPFTPPLYIIADKAILPWKGGGKRLREEAYNRGKNVRWSKSSLWGKPN